MYVKRALLALPVLAVIWIPEGSHDPPRPPPNAERPTGVAFPSQPPSDLSSSQMGVVSVLKTRRATSLPDPPPRVQAAAVAPSRPSTAPTQHLVMSNAAIWACIRQHESGDNYSENTGNGYYGAYQFLIGTWNSIASRYDSALVGVRPDLATPAEQDQMAIWTQQTSGWGQWSTAAGCGA